MGRHMMDILGESVVRDMSVGFDWGSFGTGLANAAAGTVSTAVQQKKESDAKAKDKSDQEAALLKSLTADAQWANAEANLELASIDHTSQAAAQVMRDKAKSDADAAAAALSSDGRDKRCKKAADNLQDMASAAHAAPKDVAKQAKFHAWQKVAAVCGPPSSSGDDNVKIEKHGGESFLTKKHAGLPTWGWGLIGVGGLIALFMILKSMRK